MHVSALPGLLRAESTPPDRAQYDAALQAARLGRAEMLVDQFQAWARAFPAQIGYTYDALQVEAWAGHHADVLRQWPALDQPVTPSWVLRAIGFSARSSGHPEIALQAYQRAVARDAQDWDAHAGLILSEVEAGRLAGARQRFEQLRPVLRTLSPAAALPVFRADMVLADAGRDDFALLDASTHVLDALPDDRVALQARARALVRLGAAPRAQQLPGTDLTEAPHQALAQSANGRRFQWAQADMDTGVDAARFDSMRELLLQVDQAFPQDSLRAAHTAEARQVACTAPGFVASMSDVLFGLVESGHSADAVQLYQRIAAAGCTLPPYAQAEAAAAYAAQREPVQAEALYRSALQDQRAAGLAVPQAWWFGLFYALSDQQRHAEAIAGMQDLLADPACGTAPSPNDRVAPANPDRLSCRLLLAQLLLNANQLDAAQAELVPLRDRAPADGALRLAWASLLQARERPLAAHQELAALVADEPQALNARTALASSAFARHDYRSARALAAQLGAAGPDQNDVLMLRRDLAIWQRPQVTASVEFDRGNGSGSASGGHGISADLRAYSAPIQDNLRVFAHSYTGQGNVPAGSVRRSRLGAGVELRATDLDATAEISQSLAAGREQGVALALAYRLSDRWRVAGTLDTSSNELPYAAYLNGISGRTAGLRISNIQSEARRFDASLNRTAFSDSNGRNEVNLAWTERWISAPVYQFDTVLGLGVSRNSLSNTPYYNPSADRTTSLALVNQWLTSRTAQRTFTQRLIVDVGGYQQAGQAGSALEGVRYEHLWQWGPALDYRYGAGLQHRPYDGVGATRAFGYFDLSWYP